MARLIESVIGHEREIVKIFQLKNSNHWPHAVVFVGPSGIGKKKIALALAQSLICTQASDGCGTCGPCLRVEKLQSENLTVLEPDAELSKPVIKVEKIRNLLMTLSLASIGPARVVIIENANTMNPQASNALLKTLEEPTENIFFILLANDLNQLLPTIRSRCQIFRFSGLSYEQLKILKPGLSDWNYRSSRGQVDKLELLTTKDGALKREEALGFLEQFCKDENFLEDKTWKDLVKDRSWALFSLNCWLQILRDAVVLKTQAQKFILNSDQNERLKMLHTLSLKKLLWFCNQLIQAEREINSNFDATLIFESLKVQYARMD